MGRIKNAGRTLVLGLLGSLAMAMFVPNMVPHSKGETVMEFGRSGACYTCGSAAPVWLIEPDGKRWYITEPGTVQELGLKYCPANQVCKVKVAQ